MRFKSLLAYFIATALLPAALAAKSASGSESATTVVTNAATQKNFSSKTSSDDALIRNLHWMGLIHGQTNILRCACPVMDVAEQMKTATPTDADLKLAR